MPVTRAPRRILRFASGMGLALLGLLADAAPLRARDEEPRRPSHVVLVVLGGGVRSADLLDAGRMPVLAGWGARGIAVDRVRSGARDAWTGAARILTGVDEGLDGAARARPGVPTLMEVVRSRRGLPREAVWFVSFEESADALRLSFSTDPEYGPGAAPSGTYGQGPFAQPLGPFLERTGRPLPLSPEAFDLLRGLRAMSREAASVWLPEGVGAGTAAAERVERALLRDLDRRTLLAEGPIPRDERAHRAARAVLEIHRPTLLVLHLGEAEAAQVSFERYGEVLAAWDRALGRLEETVRADPALAGRTAFFVVADRGRDERPSAQGGLGEGQPSARDVAVVAFGPGLRARTKPKGPRSIEDLCPTIGALLGVETPRASGRVWSEVLLGP